MGVCQKDKQMENESNRNTAKSKIIVADEYPLMRKALSQAIDTQYDLITCCRTENTEQTIAAIEQFNPDLLVLSLYLPGAIALDLLRRIRLEHPKLPILAMSIQSDSTQAAEALRAGAKGYISKRESEDAIIEAIKQVLTGTIWVNRDFMPNLLERYFGKDISHENIKTILTKREVQIFEMMGKGVTTRQIADQLFISQRTVESHRDHIKGKLKVDDVFKLHQMAFQWVQEEMALGR